MEQETAYISPIFTLRSSPLYPVQDLSFRSYHFNSGTSKRLLYKFFSPGKGTGKISSALIFPCWPECRALYKGNLLSFKLGFHTLDSFAYIPSQRKYRAILQC